MGSFPADLAAQASFVAAALDVMGAEHEGVEDGFDEVPVLSAAGEEADEVSRSARRTEEAIDVNDGEITPARSGDIEAEAVAASGSEELCEGLADDAFDLAFAGELVFGTEFAEEFDDLALFEVKAFDLIIDPAALDGGPIHNAASAARRVAHVFLLEDFRKAGAV